MRILITACLLCLCGLACDSAPTPTGDRITERYLLPGAGKVPDQCQGLSCRRPEDELRWNGEYCVCSPSGDAPHN